MEDRPEDASRGDSTSEPTTIDEALLGSRQPESIPQSSRVFADPLQLEREQIIFRLHGPQGLAAWKQLSGQLSEDQQQQLTQMTVELFQQKAREDFLNAAAAEAPERRAAVMAAGMAGEVSDRIRTNPETGEQERAIIIKSPETGYERLTWWPESNEGRVAKMRDILFQVQDTLSSEGTQSQRTALSELFAVLGVFEQGSLQAPTRPTPIDPDRENDEERYRRDEERYRQELAEHEVQRRDLKEFGESMYREFYRLYHMHGSYVNFWGATDVQGVANAIGSFYRDQLNFFFRDAPDNYRKFVGEDNHNSDLLIWAFFQEYEKNALRFLMETEEERKDDAQGLRKQMRNAVSGLLGPEPQDNNQKRYREISLKLAQLNAERLWDLTLRRFKHERLRDSNNRIYESEEELYKAQEEAKRNHKPPPTIEFMGDAVMGQFPARRAAMVKMRLWQQSGGHRTFMKLIDGVDFNDRDYISQWPGEFRAILERRLIEIYLRRPENSGRSRDDIAEIASEDSWQYMSAIVGSGNINVETDSHGKISRSFKHGRDLEATKIIFSKSDLRRIGISDEDQQQRLAAIEKLHNSPDLQVLFKSGRLVDFEWINPPGAAVARHVLGPDKLRDALEQPDGYTREPSSDHLIKLSQLQLFMGPRQYTNSVKMITNLAEFMMSDDAREAHFIPLNEGQSDTMIANLAHHMKVSHHEVEEIGKHVFGDGVWPEVRLLVSKYNLGHAFLSMLLEILLGAPKAALKAVA